MERGFCLLLTLCVLGLISSYNLHYKAFSSGGRSIGSGFILNKLRANHNMKSSNSESQLYPKQNNSSSHINEVVASSLWRDFILHYKNNPFPAPPVQSNRALPLDQMVPFFLSAYNNYFPKAIMQFCSPAVAVVRVGDKLNIVTNKPSNFMSQDSRTTQCPTFGTFTGGEQETDLADKRLAYLMLGMFGKCDQVVICFAELIQRMIHSHQMTYQGEKIIGWALQNGIINLKHPAIVSLRALNAEDLSVVPALLDSIRSGKPQLPAGVIKIDLGRNDDHVWLTFVTEAGQVFDLDLSALQFGMSAPFPCIIPVLCAEPTAFSGLCTRLSIASYTFEDFQDATRGLSENRIKFLNSRPGTGQRPTAAGLARANDEFIDFLLSNLGEVPKFEDPRRFWSIVLGR